MKHFKESINIYSLKFKNNDIELLFENKEMKIQMKSLKRFTLVMTLYFLFAALIGEINKWENKLYWWVRFVCSAGIFTLIMLLLKFKRTRGLTKYYLCACLTGFYFHNCEIIRGNFHALQPGQIFYQANLSILCFVYQIVLRVSWKINSVMIFLSSIYTGFRFLNITDFSQDSYFFNIGLLCFATFFWLFLNYKHEMHERFIFLSLIKSKEHLSYYKRLIEEILPTPIFILSESPSKGIKPILFNKAASNIFGDISGKLTDLEDVATEILIDENDSVILDRKIMFKKEVLQYKSSRWNKQKNTLFDFINFQEINKNIEINTFKTFNATYKLGFEKRHYEIKHGLIRWGIENEENSVNVRIFIFNDITNSRRIAEMQLLDQNKDRLLATISHELKTPLNGVLGNLELFLSEYKFRGEDKNMKQALKVALRSGLLLSEYITNLLDFSALEKKSIVLEMRKVAINELLEKLKILFKFQTKSKGLKFSIENDFSDQDCFYADASKLKQVLVNLLSNALKYTSEGSIKLSVKHLPTKELIDEISKDTDLFAFISVEDTGCGIKEEDIPQLFEFKPNRLGSESPKKSGSYSFNTGVGLGLSLSQAFVRAMMSEYGIKSNDEPLIKVNSKQGVGTRFSFYMKVIEDNGTSNILESEVSVKEIFKKNVKTIPQSKSTKMMIREKSKDSIAQVNLIELAISDGADRNRNEENNSKNRQLNVLVVDDDQINLMVAVNFLKLFNCFYDTASNGREAIAKIVARSKENLFFDLILMDCNMPIMKGYEATSVIKSMIENGDIKFCHIAAVTANSDPRDIEICFSAGMNFYINKPLSKQRFSELFAELAKVV